MEHLPLVLTEDRGLSVPPGARVLTGYVPVEKCRMACRDRMAVGDVERAHRRLLQAAPSQPWPCPTGRWDGDTFEIVDGRHAFLAALMIGHTHLLVAWIEKA